MTVRPRMNLSYNKYLFIGLITILSACSPPVTIHKKSVEKIITKTIAYSQSMTDSYLVGKPSNKVNILWVANSNYNLPRIGDVDLNQALYTDLLERVVENKFYNMKTSLYSDSLVTPRTYFFQSAPFSNAEVAAKNEAVIKCHLYEIFGSYRTNYNHTDCMDSKLSAYLKDFPASYSASSGDYNYSENLFSIASNAIESEFPFTEGISKGQKLVIIFSNAIYWQYNDNGTRQKLKEHADALRNILKKRWRLHNVKIISLHIGKKSSNSNSFCTDYVEHNKNFENQIKSIGNPELHQSFLNLCDYSNGYQQNGSYQEPTEVNQQTLSNHSEIIWDDIIKFKSAMILSEKPDEPENIRIDICGNIMSLESSPFSYHPRFNQLTCKSDNNCAGYSNDSANTCAANIDVNYHADEAHIIDLKEIDDAGIKNFDDVEAEYKFEQE